MANLPGEVKQALLIELYESAKNGASPLTLAQAITARIVSAAASIKSGSFITQHSGNGFSTTQEAPGWGGLNPSEMAAFGAELRKLHTDCVTALTAELGATPDDDAIFEEMLFQLEPIRAMQNDYSGAGYA